jgi:hypothetical protein
LVSVEKPSWWFTVDVAFGEDINVCMTSELTTAETAEMTAADWLVVIVVAGVVVNFFTKH